MNDIKPFKLEKIEDKDGNLSTISASERGSVTISADAEDLFGLFDRNLNRQNTNYIIARLPAGNFICAQGLDIMGNGDNTHLGVRGNISPDLSKLLAYHDIDPQAAPDAASLKPGETLHFYNDAMPRAKPRLTLLKKTNFSGDIIKDKEPISPPSAQTEPYKNTAAVKAALSTVAGLGAAAGAATTQSTGKRILLAAVSVITLGLAAYIGHTNNWFKGAQQAAKAPQQRG